MSLRLYKGDCPAPIKRFVSEAYKQGWLDAYGGNHMNPYCQHTTEHTDWKDGFCDYIDYSLNQGLN